MIFWVSALALIFSVVGNLLVNIKKRYGFLVWIISNIIWIAVNVMGVPNYPQITMYALYIGMNVHGFLYWKRTDK